MLAETFQNANGLHMKMLLVKMEVSWIIKQVSEGKLIRLQKLSAHTINTSVELHLDLREFPIQQYQMSTQPGSCKANIMCQSSNHTSSIHIG
jgi:hypothetical protein